VTKVITDRRYATDRHASRASLHPYERTASTGDYYYPPDPDTDDFCPGCTPELGERGWQHDRACPARPRTA